MFLFQKIAKNVKKNPLNVMLYCEKFYFCTQIFIKALFKQRLIYTQNTIIYEKTIIFYCIDRACTRT